jgi:hypothetical protein
MSVDPKKAVADIDSVLAHQADFGGTGAVSEVSALRVACIKRWAPPGSSYQGMLADVELFTEKYTRMDRATPACREMNPRRSSMTILWWTERGETMKNCRSSASDGEGPCRRMCCWMKLRYSPCLGVKRTAVFAPFMRPGMRRHRTLTARPRATPQKLVRQQLAHPARMEHR